MDSAISIFPSTNSRMLASNVASMHVKAGAGTLALRVRLQRLLDSANTLPVISTENGLDSTEELRHQTSGILRNVLSDLVYTLNQSDTKLEGKKRDRTTESSIDENMAVEDMWEQVIQPQKRMRRSWDEIIGKFHARAHFGSEANKSKLKAFNQSIFDQIDVALADESRVQEKSRCLWEVSPRLNKDNAKGTSDKVYDNEVYDDRQFYSFLVKSFVSSMTGNDAIDQNDMREEDLKALRAYRKKKDNVDRKASKGRKIRYTVHTKLQNFMFPIQQPVPQIDVDKLFQSLFQ